MSDKKMNILEQPINYKDLETELHETLRADELYKLQNDAKIRAVEQKVPTYEDFKEMVNGAHLRPLERADTKAKIGVPWNTVANDNSNIENNSYETSIARSNRIVDSKHETISDLIPNEIPKTVDEFLQVWKNLADHRAKFTYLSIIRSSFRELFRTEIPSGLIGGIINTCLKALLNKEDIGNILDIVTKLSEANRFGLSLFFTSREEHAIFKEFFQKLLDTIEAKEYVDSINVLRRKYVA